MSNSSSSVLALLLTLPDLEPPLTADQQGSLNDLGYLLEKKPDDWASIESDLVDIVNDHPAWSQQFAATKAKLDDLGGNIPLGLLPTLEEVERALPSEVEPSKRGPLPNVDSDREEEQRNLLENISVRILTGPNPQKITQEIGLGARLKKLLPRSASNS